MATPRAERKEQKAPSKVAMADIAKYAPKSAAFDNLE
jgi:hypothetical protein